MKNIPNMAPPSAKPATFEPVTARMRKIENGMIGARERSSMATKIAISSAEPTRRPIVVAEVQPSEEASTSAYTSRASDAVIETPPARSKRRWADSARLSRSRNGADAITARPTGTFSRKIHSQPIVSVKTPPRSTPTVPPEAPTAPQMPSALLRSEPSAKVVMRIDRAAGVISAAPTPWKARAPIRVASVLERPAISEAAEKRATPVMNTRRRPTRSAMRPPSSSRPPKVRA